MLFDKIIQNYTEYIKLDYYKKLHAGELLAESAKLLLDIDNEVLNNETVLQRNYFMKKIADDLASQARDMAYTKQYDCHPVLKKYTYLAYDLMLEYYDHKPYPQLIPFLKSVIYYERQHPKGDQLEKLENLLKQCER
jgi:hypothetical protein